MSDEPDLSDLPDMPTNDTQDSELIPESTVTPESAKSASELTDERTPETTPEAAGAMIPVPVSQTPPTVIDVQPIREETLDGLRAWQSAVVRLWSASEDAFAELTLTWLPADVEGAPWTARLYCGDRAEPGWIEDVRVMAAASIQQALQKLWDRAQVRHGLFKEDPDLTTKLPTDFPADLWLTAGERALLDRTTQILKRTRAKAIIRLSYHPDRRLSVRWTAILHATGSEPPEGVIHEVNADSLLYVCDALLHALATPTTEAARNAQVTSGLDPETHALSERKTDTSKPNNDQ